MSPNYSSDTMLKDSYLSSALSHACMTMLGLPITRGFADVNPDPTLMACVQIHGETSWTLEVRATYSAACTIATAMFGTTAGDFLDAEDVRDAIGELANIIGGNVKGLICDGGALSLPCVEMQEVIRPNTDSSLSVLVKGEPMYVLLTQTSPDPFMDTSILSS